jgi:ferritin-like metal-binding protein YciE
MPTTQKRTTKRATTSKQTSSDRSKGSTGTQKRSANGHSSTHMLENLEDALTAGLSDMLYAEREFQKVLPKLASSAASRRVRDVLEWHAEQSEEQVMRLENVFKQLGHKAEAEPCEGMQGILSECKELFQKTGQGPVRDALLIAATQKADHYAIATYGTLCAWADQLEEDRVLRILDESLYEKKTADRTLSRVAEMLSNPQAERGGSSRGSGDERRSRGEQEWRGSDYDERSRGRSGRGGYDD